VDSDRFAEALGIHCWKILQKTYGQIHTHDHNKTMPVLEHEATNEKGVHLFPLYSQQN